MSVCVGGDKRQLWRTWFDVADVPPEDKVDASVDDDHDAAPLETEAVAVQRVRLDIRPLNADHLLFVASYKLGSVAEGRRRGQALETCM